jgi:glycine dehydrogenase
MHAPYRPEVDAGETSFAERHVGPNPRDIDAMLATVGAKSLDALIAEVIPASIRRRGPLALAPALSERAALDRMREIAGKNEVFTSLIGQGYYGTILPPVIQRNILENPGWYTAYTPYQPEISQGRLEALMNFQTMVADLTGLPVANASLLDEATAAAEAMTLAHRAAAAKVSSFFVDRNVHPQTLAVLQVRAEPLGIDLVVGSPGDDLARTDVFGALLQYPDTFGTVSDYRDAIAAVHARGGLAILAADPLALTLLMPPGELGADIAIGSTQRFGVPMGFGGPHAAYMAVRDDLKRNMPGRVVGLSIDARGAPAYRLALQTREQHIRREKATSNICTAQVLLAVIASMYAVYHGPDGLAGIARRIHRRTAVLANGLRRLGFAPPNETFFDTLTVAVGERQSEIIARARAERINLRAVAAGECGAEAAIGISLDETTDDAVVEAVWRAFGGTLAYGEVSLGTVEALPPNLVRRSAFLRHPVFRRYHCETEMLRYMRRLADRDLALDRAMIPLGSCTMKLNATTEMIPITWSEFADMHPFAPPEQARGYHELIGELSRMLSEATGFDAVSLQPNSGAQGEYAGLLAIRAYHRARGEAHRTVCLIPSSAHGTNPASAAMAGLKVVVVNCDKHGNVDTADLK